MRWWLLLLTIALTGAGCASTTRAGSVADDGAQRRLAANPPSEMTVDATDRGPDQPSVVIEATSPSPTDIRFRTEVQTIVPLRRRRPITVVKHGRGAAQGALIGAGIGLAAGLLLPVQKPADVNDNSILQLGQAMFLGSIGAGLGALGGALIGQPVTLAPQ